MFSGVPVIYGIDYLSSEATPQHQLGSIGVTHDGRKFRYALNTSTALVAGNLIQANTEDTGDQALAVDAAAIGAFTVTTSSTVTVTANQYANGYLAVAVTPGIGLYYRIKSHPAATAAVVTLTLFEPIEVALTTSSRIDLVKNPYDNVIQAVGSATRTGAILGVAPIALPASEYGWIQTSGPANTLCEAGAAVVIGNLVVASDSTAGAVQPAVNDTTELFPIVGRAMTGIAVDQCGLVYLSLE